MLQIDCQKKSIFTYSCVTLLTDYSCLFICFSETDGKGKGKGEGQRKGKGKGKGKGRAKR